MTLLKLWRVRAAVSMAVDSYKDDYDKVAERCKVLYGLDKVNNVRFSHENPEVLQCYRDYFKEPLSEKSHELLHTSHTVR